MRPEWPKIEAESGGGAVGERGQQASSHQLEGLRERRELPKQGSGHNSDRPTVFHYFQHSGWPLLTL